MIVPINGLDEFLKGMTASKHVLEQRECVLSKNCTVRDLLNLISKLTSKMYSLVMYLKLLSLQYVDHLT